MKSKSAVLMLCLTTGLIVGGCAGGLSSSESIDGVPAKVAEKFPKNRDRWALPLDSYVFNPGVLESKATQIRMGACMKEAGYSSPDYEINIDAPPSESLSPGGNRFLNERLAKKWGYREAPSKQINSAQRSRVEHEYDAQLDAPGRAARAKCIEDLNKHPIGDDMVLQGALKYAPSIDPDNDPALKGPIAKWHECMKPLGLPELPEGPIGMAGVVLGPENEATSAPDVEVYENPVPKREIEIAVKDAQCQESSGYAQTLYDITWTAEAKAYMEHEDDLERIKAANEKYRKDLLAVIEKGEQ